MFKFHLKGGKISKFTLKYKINKRSSKICNNGTINQSTLKKYLHYCPDYGIFTWIKVTNQNMVVGSIAGGVSTGERAGYIRIRLLYKKYMAHRLAWLYMTGMWPDCEIDHKNGVRTDNKWDNLRLTNNFQNQQNVKIQKNNTTGYKGVHVIKKIKYKKYHASIRANGKLYDLGNFYNPKEAHAAYCKAAKVLHKEFARVK